MDMSIQLKATMAPICTLSLDFNNNHPLGTFPLHRRRPTFLARYNDLFTGDERKVA